MKTEISVRITFKKPVFFHVFRMLIRYFEFLASDKRSAVIIDSELTQGVF